jgi:hypothetical protein
MKNAWTRTEFCEMKVKKNSKKMDENFTKKDLWEMVKILALILFLMTMGFLNAEPQYDEWKVLDLPYETNGMIVLSRTGHLNHIGEPVYYWYVVPREDKTNEIITLYRLGRSAPGSWQCPKPSCGHMNYDDFLNCGLCGTDRYAKF